MKTLVATLMMTSTAFASSPGEDLLFDFETFSQFIVANSACTDFAVDVVGIARERNTIGAKLHWPMEKILKQGGIYEERAKEKVRENEYEFCDDVRRTLGFYDKEELRSRGVIY